LQVYFFGSTHAWPRVSVPYFFCGSLSSSKVVLLFCCCLYKISHPDMEKKDSTINCGVKSRTTIQYKSR
jgi:hypothetical protein